MGELRNNAQYLPVEKDLSLRGQEIWTGAGNARYGGDGWVGLHPPLSLPPFTLPLSCKMLMDL